MTNDNDIFRITLLLKLQKESLFYCFNHHPAIRMATQVSFRILLLAHYRLGLISRFLLSILSPWDFHLLSVKLPMFRFDYSIQLQVPQLAHLKILIQRVLVVISSSVNLDFLSNQAVI